VAELVSLLRRQRDDSAFEKADLTARLAVAEQRAAEAEQRIFDAERHAATASARVEEIESALRSRVDQATAPRASRGARAVPASDAPTGPSVTELVREAEALRQQLAEAEGRAAKFSSRLAMVRTEAEDAQRQVATMSTRLDRHQAEWAAERISLLNRIAQSEAALQAGDAPAAIAERSSSAGGVRSTGSAAADVENSAAVEYAKIVGSPRAVAAARAASARAASLTRPGPEPEATDTPAVDPEATTTLLDPKPETAVPATGPEILASPAGPAAPSPATGDGSEPGTHAGPSGAESSGAGSAEVGTADGGSTGTKADPASERIRDEAAGIDAATARVRPSVIIKERPSAVAGAAARVGVRPGATGEQAAGGRVVMESSPRWNGLLDPAVAGGDNLKEIVGVGPVIEARLRSLGITTFGQLAEMGDTDVARLSRMLDGFGDRILSDDWVGQAQDLQVRHYGGVY
jgi:predicted flap endonuclease-1-like 5' DNA nuclease